LYSAVLLPTKASKL